MLKNWTWKLGDNSVKRQPICTNSYTIITRMKFVTNLMEKFSNHRSSIWSSQLYPDTNCTVYKVCCAQCWAMGKPQCSWKL